MAELLYRLGRTAARRVWAVLAAWAAVAVAVGIAFGVGAGTLSDAIDIPGTPTAEVTERLQTEFPEASGGTGSVVATTADGSEFTAEQQTELAALGTQAEEIDGVASVVDPFATETQRSQRASELEQGRTEAEAGQAELADQQAQLEAGRTELEDQQAQLEQAREQAEADGSIAWAGPELDAQLEGIEQGLAEMDGQQEQLDQGLTELTGQMQQLELGERMLELTDGVRQVSEDGSAAVIPVSFTESQFEVPQETKDALVALFSDNPIDGVHVDFSSEIVQGIPSILGVGELIGVIVAAVVLLVMLGSLVAAGLPILNALIGVAISALGALSLSSVVEMVSVTPILGVMLGLAVGIDYSLFIINRHRRQLKDGYDLEESIGLANGTSGNAVVFAGITVVIALLALNITGIPFLGLMGTVGAVSVAVAVLVAITLTPAWLKLIGMRALSPRERAKLTEHGAAAAKPVPPKPMSTVSAVARAVLGIAALAVIAIPALDLRLNLPDGSSEPHDSTQYQAYSTVAEQFGEGMNGPLLVVADLPEPAGEEELPAQQLEIGEQLMAQDDVTAVAPFGASEDGTVLGFQVIPAEGPTAESTEALVHELRGLDLDGDVTIAVAGQASGNIDISDKLAEALPIYLAVVVGLSLLILILVFRSILVPVIATAGFILSYFAALGGVVAIYQWGWLPGIFGVESPGPILNFLPTIAVGILFGLAMDYMLFLGTGMREAYAHGVDARQAVVQGFRAGRSVVAAAAIIMVSVFGGFIFAESAMIRPIGFALAFGVLVDAFVVRMLIIPALMHLFGKSAWWLPRWLDRILPDVDVEGAKLERRHPHVAESEDPEPVEEDSKV
ncbi:MMPL family transporter [Ruania zhangjianzhongii]|uniref:MMPL family transporter n=1 Tax=Ruania zhangjianzhongii TaxID=2603206 RepID=UPI0011CC95AF|nr:MMPL family transporter [Ruania zhangjianzhongii]